MGFPVPPTQCTVVVDRADWTASREDNRLHTNTDIVIDPEIAARGINLRIPLPETGQIRPRPLQDRVAAVSGLHLVELLTAADDPGHLRLRSGGGAGNVHAHVVVEPEVGAFCGLENGRALVRLGHC